jgi:predicted esterase
VLALLLTFLVGLSPRSALPPAQSELPRGQIIESVVCAGDPKQSYALYLPANYTETRHWPVLYAFDPAARGKVPVERYREAAEKFGWIVAGSNNSRNGNLQSSLDAWNGMVTDTTSRFAIDQRRAYATGFSGGARVALIFAIQCNSCLAGVIASGAGFPGATEPAAKMQFAIFSTAGLDDFNFAEIKLLEEKLSRVNITHQTEVFEGRHEWPPAPVAESAIGWMELMAMKSGRRDRDESLIHAWSAARLKQAEGFEDSKRPYDAYRVYLELSVSLKGLRDVSEFETRANQLGNSREVRDEIRDEQQQIQKQRDLEREIGTLTAAGERARIQETDQRPTNTGRDNDEGFDPNSRLHSVLTKLNRDAKAESDSATRRVARRVLEGEFILLVERGQPILQSGKNYDEAVRIFTLATEVAPERASAFYNLAWAYSGKGDKKKSLRALQTAVEKGFSDGVALANNKAFDSIRNDPQYQKIISSLKPGP